MLLLLCVQVQETGIARHVFDDKEGGFDEPETADAEGQLTVSLKCFLPGIFACSAGIFFPDFPG